MSHSALRREFSELIDLDAPVERLAGGFTFTEGPIWHPRDQYLLFSDMPADVRRRYDERTGVREVMCPSNKCNGMTYDANLALIVCEHATSNLVRERNGRREILASHFEGKELNSPNDVCVRSDGSIYFSDPWYGRMPVYGVERPRQLGFQGVYRVPPGRRRAAAPGRSKPLRSTQWPLLFAGRATALCERHGARVDSRLRRKRGRISGTRPDLRLRHTLRTRAGRA